jgi:2-hydroxychromene-2-carboxylate isomerase
MKHLHFYFDPISPYAYLAFEQLPKALQGLSYSVTYRPVLFAAMLKHYGQLGPAEIRPKRTWTYRQISWLAKEQGTDLAFPATHPFNPLGLLRLGIACGQAGACNRYVAETLLHHVWQGGYDAADEQRLQALVEHLQPQRALNDAAVKAELKTNTDAAIAAGVFGVPTVEVDGQYFWGLDAQPMLRGYLSGDAWFGSAAWTKAADVPTGAMRQTVSERGL